MSTAVEPRVKAFLTTGEAAEMLLFAGFKVSLDNPGGGASKSICANGETVAFGYRDGTNWKFKRDTVQDFIDENAL